MSDRSLGATNPNRDLDFGTVVTRSRVRLLIPDGSLAPRCAASGR